MKISILSPDLSDNCLGRAYLLAGILRRRYQVEIIGPRIFREGIWAPVAGDRSIPYRTVRLCGVVSPYRRIRQLAGKIGGDVIYACKPLLTSFGIGLLKKKLDGRPLVLDIDDWEIGSIRQHYGKLSPFGRARYLAGSAILSYKMGSWWNIARHEKLIPRADEITVSNRFLQKRYGGELVWHARDTDAFHPGKYDGDTGKSRMGIDGKKKVVMFLGTPRPPKGLDVALEAVRRIEDRDVILVVVGMGENNYCRRLRATGERLLGERFRGLGMQPFEKIPEFLSMADAVLIPQEDNPATVGQLPAKVFDAMAMAKPIAATRVSDLPEILEGCGWIVEPGSPEGLTAAVRSILDNPGEAAERGRLARRKCIERYSWDAMEKVLAGIFGKFA